MEQRYVLIETGAEPKIYQVPLIITARLINQYPDRKVTVFETLREATMAALASIERAESQSRSGVTVVAAQPSPGSEALRRRFLELTEDRVETFIL